MSKKPYIAHVCPHTHWDREWYSPFQTYRMRLVRLMDHLLDIMEQDPDFRLFNLDGQTIPLTDYLEIRPENETRLRNLISEGHIIVGPWFNLPDEFLVSGEAIIRNLQLGHQMASDYGSLNKVGYVPDMFGHISQMPQILRGFDLDTAFAWRGLSGDELKSELWWDAPDGSRVLLNKFPDYIGYSNACGLPPDLEEAVEELECIVRTQAARATTPHLLVMLGTDHLEPRADLAQLIQMANERSSLAIYRIASYEEYAEAVKAAVADGERQVVTGELRDTNRSRWGGGIVLPNTLSAHVYLKQQNVATQTLLERWVEPYATFLWLMGEPYPARYIQVAWTWLLENHPHDSICGTSVDHVHNQMETRFQWAQDIGETLMAEQFDSVVNRVDLSLLEEGEAAVALVNGLSWERDEAVTVDLDIPAALFASPQDGGEVSEIDYEEHHAAMFRQRRRQIWRRDIATPQPPLRGIRLRDLSSGEDIPAQIESYVHLPIERNLRHGPLALETVYRVRASFHPPAIPPMGYRMLGVRPSSTPVLHETPPPVNHLLENEHLRIVIEASGTLSLTEKASGQTFSGLAYFEDGGDAGDTYNYSPPIFDQVYTTLASRPRIRREAWGPALQRYAIEYDWQLPAGLTTDRQSRQEARVTCPLTLRVTLGAGMRRVKLDVAFENRAKDHRLRIIFPTGLRPALSQSDTPFDVVDHPLRMPPVDPQVWQEDPPVQMPATSFFDVRDPSAGVGLGILHVGLHEYEVAETGEAAVTLLRAVGSLGGGLFMQTMLTGAGPAIPTPGAQVQRSLTCELGLVPHEGDWAEAELWREAQALNIPIRSRSKAMPHPWLTGESERDDLPLQHSFLKLTGRNVVLSAVTQAQDGEALIVRVFNPSDRAESAHLKLNWPVERASLARLDEVVEDSLPVAGDGSIPFEVSPHRILTLKVWLARS